LSLDLEYIFRTDFKKAADSGLFCNFLGVTYMDFDAVNKKVDLLIFVSCGLNSVNITILKFKKCLYYKPVLVYYPISELCLFSIWYVCKNLK
jgi:hypothetical protein